jgi:hypothetical protein
MSKYGRLARLMNGRDEVQKDSKAAHKEVTSSASGLRPQLGLPTTPLELYITVSWLPRSAQTTLAELIIIWGSGRLSPHICSTDESH